MERHLDARDELTPALQLLQQLNGIDIAIHVLDEGDAVRSRMPEPGPHGLEVILEFRLGRIGLGLAAGDEAQPVALALGGQRRHRIDRLALAQLALRQPIRTHDDLVARPQLAALQDARLLECDRIGPGRVMVGREDDDRPVPHDPVEVMARQRFVLADDHVIRLAADHEVVAGMLLQIGLGARLQLLEAARAGEVEVGEFGCTREQVHVAFDEARDDGSAPGIDHAGVGTLITHHLSMSPQAHDPIPGNGNRFGGRTSLVHGQDGGIGDDERCSHDARSPFQSMPSASIIAAHEGRAVTRPMRRLRLGYAVAGCAMALVQRQSMARKMSTPEKRSPSM